MVTQRDMELAQTLHLNILSTDGAKYPLNYTCTNTAELIAAHVAQETRALREAFVTLKTQLNNRMAIPASGWKHDLSPGSQKRNQLLREAIAYIDAALANTGKGGE